MCVGSGENCSCIPNGMENIYRLRDVAGDWVVIFKYLYGIYSSERRKISGLNGRFYAFRSWRIKTISMQSSGKVILNIILG